MNSRTHLFQTSYAAHSRENEQNSHRSAYVEVRPMRQRHAPGTHPRQYLVSRGRNVLYSLKVCQNCYQIACRTDAHTVQSSVCGTRKTPRQSESPYFA